MILNINITIKRLEKIQILVEKLSLYLKEFLQPSCYDIMEIHDKKNKKK